MKADLWLVECARCSKPKAPLGYVPVNASEADDYCMRNCSGYAEWPYASKLPQTTEGTP